jgi:broad specificity phosphatase PhoE
MKPNSPPCPPPLRRLIIVRHGESLANRQERIAGSLDSPLTQEGIRQAELVADRLACERVDWFLASPLSRASQTAQIIARNHASSVETHDGLRERCWGDLEGAPYQEARKLFEAPEYDPATFRPPGEGGESLQDVVARLEGTLDNRIHRTFRRGTGVIVAHAGTNRALLTWLLREDYLHRARQENTAIHILEDHGEGFRIAVLNCTKHLGLIEVGAP